MSNNTNNKQFLIDILQSKSYATALSIYKSIFPLDLKFITSNGT